MASLRTVLVIVGLTIAFVGITFPILMPLMGGAPPSLGLLALAFGSGFAGVMLSPVHLCLVLSGEYFNADMAKVYQRLWLPSARTVSPISRSLFFSWANVWATFLLSKKLRARFPLRLKFTTNFKCGRCLL